MNKQVIPPWGTPRNDPEPQPRADYDQMVRQHWQSRDVAYGIPLRQSIITGIVDGIWAGMLTFFIVLGCSLVTSRIAELRPVAFSWGWAILAGILAFILFSIPRTRKTWQDRMDWWKDMVNWMETKMEQPPQPPEPQVVERIAIVKPDQHQQQFADLPEGITAQQMNRLARGLLDDGRRFVDREWMRGRNKTFTPTQWEELRDWMDKNKFMVWKDSEHRVGVNLTPEGLATLRTYASEAWLLDAYYPTPRRYRRDR